MFRQLKTNKRKTNIFQTSHYFLFFQTILYISIQTGRTQQKKSIDDKKIIDLISRNNLVHIIIFRTQKSQPYYNLF